MSNITVQVNGVQSAELPREATVADALKQLDRDDDRQALAAKVAVRERSRGDIGSMSVEDSREPAAGFVRSRSLVNET